jgi:ribonucleoside-diphosphate reductase alpha chain
MQAAFQKYTDNAVSKTVNFPNDATIDQVREVYVTAHALKCKGVTVYRDGSRSGQVLNVGTAESSAPAREKQGKVISEKKERACLPRPTLTFGQTRKVKTGCGNLYVTINENEDEKPFEIFSTMGKAGGCAASQSEAISRLISLSLRSGIDSNSILRQLKSISCHKHSWDQGKRIASCADAVSFALEIYLKDKKNKLKEVVEPGSSRGDAQPVETILSSSLPDSEADLRGACPDCGGMLEHGSGCVSCLSCGFSEC